MTKTEHIAERPSWDCLLCRQPWPCAPARAALAEELDSVQLAIYMWANIEEAAPQLAGMSMSETFDRFLAWTR